MSEGPPSPPPPSPPRKKARALHLQTHGSTSGPGLHPLPSPSNSPPPSISEPAQAESSTVTTTYSNSPPELPILPLQTLMSLPMLLTQYSQLPAALQTHVLLSLLKLSPLSVLRATDGFVTPALSRDFLSLLPTELSLQILQCLDLRSLLRCCRVCRNWRDLIDGEAPLWRSILKHYKLWFESPSRASLPPSMRLSAHLRPPANYLPTLRPPNPYKTLLRYRLRLQQALTQCPSQMTIPLLTQTVVTCLQISATRIVSASDDHTIHVHSPIDGALLQSLQGHSGGVWALQFVHNTLVSGSTDRTVRVWDLRTGTNTHVFAGHTSTVRCLQIVEKGDNGTWPRRRMIITGSRDNSLRLWYLPREGDAEYKSPGTGEGDTDRDEPQRNPYHVRLFAGHTSAVRALAARGKTLVSGSYDCTVRVWDMSTGECRFVLSGHAQKVYSVALDPIRERCASGSMDGTVRIWCLETGQCLHALTGHTSLVGLLSIRPNQLISAAADSTLRVWSPTSGDLLHTLTGHPAAITCFLHDEFRVLSGSEGSLKMWDADKGEWRRDLLTEVGGVWQVAGWGRRVVSASNRGDETYLDVFEWGGETDADGLLIDDDALYDDASEVSEDSDTADDEEAEHEASYEGEDDGQASRSVKAGQSPYPPAEHVRRVIRQQDEDEIMSQSYGDAEDELDVEEDIDIRHEPVRHLKAPAHISTRAMEPGSEHAADEARDMDPWELSTPTPAPRARSFLGFTGQSLRLPSASSSIAGSSRGSRGNRRWGDDTET
ncbi:WD40 repeat-like protein [Dacryopinax primogenitus]|uniref:WD40 repeat-like protein n=1 Tax=Dacryopinax primogenitus (strain DJM 731) TaxID=1858805 RepID=M5FS62_DACPD|nr:WD40 repeat-like protein [Dacryopinax primogenitus]EJU00171.1 WD40 repeat-like protein [Dacryopinax primogenitus]